MKEYHWWIVAKDETGRPYVVYGCADRGSDGGEDNAKIRALDLVGGMDWYVKRLPTRNLQAARAFICGNRLESGLDLRESVARQGHEKSLERRRRTEAQRW